MSNNTGNEPDFGNLPTAPYGTSANPAADPGQGAPGTPGAGGGKSGKRSWPRGKRSWPRGKRSWPRGKRSWPRGKQAAAVLAVCAVAGGGAFAVTEALSGSAAASAQAATAATGFQAGTSASLTGQAAALNGALSAGGPGRLARLRRLGGMYGQYTYETKTGSHTLAFERGTITSVSSSAVVVRAANGTSWTWDLTSTSVVRENGAKQAESTLADGDSVFTAGPVTNGARDARVIVIRKAVGAS